MKINIELKGEVPTKKNSYRISKHGGFYKPTKITDWETDCLWQIKEQKIPKMAGHFKVDMIFFITREKDVDNMATSIFDILQKSQTIDNDSHILELSAIKRKVKKNPKVLVSVDLI